MQQAVFRPTLPALRAGAFALGLACSTHAAHAADATNGTTPAWTLSGFGTLGMVHSNRHDADFTASVLKAGGAGHTHPWSIDVDSRFGAQLDLALDRRWSAVVQVVSEQSIDNSYRPTVEWANIKYQVTPDLALRAGRIALPMFLAADYRKVGYIYPWVRPPVEVYGSLPVFSSDGVDLTWRWSSGSVRHATQAFYGRADRGLGESGRLRARAIAGFSSTAEMGAASARVSLLTTKLTLDGWRDLFGAFSAFGPGGAELAERYEVERKRASLASIGLNYDPGQWFATAEAGHARTNSFLGNTTSLYASAGYRWRAFTPWLSYAKVRAESPTHDPGLPLAGLPKPMAIAGAGLNSGLNELLSSIPTQSTVSLGARWDFRPNFALKLQYDRVTPRDGSSGTLINVQPGFVSGCTIHVASVALDFVF